MVNLTHTFLIILTTKNILFLHFYEYILGAAMKLKWHTCQCLGLLQFLFWGFLWCPPSTSPSLLWCFQRVWQEVWLANFPPSLVYSGGTPGSHLPVINHSIKPWSSLHHFAREFRFCSYVPCCVSLFLSPVCKLPHTYSLPTSEYLESWIFCVNLISLNSQGPLTF